MDSHSHSHSHSHSQTTLDLAKQESAEHLGPAMTALSEDMRSRKVTISAVLVQPQSPPPPPPVPPPSHKLLKTKIVHFMRHGQGFHNLLADLRRAEGRNWTQFSNDPTSNPYVMPEVLDAPLTDIGREQAKAARADIAAAAAAFGGVEVVLVSPLTRATQTGVIAFGEVTDKFVAYEGAREEAGVHLCDKRRSLEDVKREFPMVDYSNILHDVDPIFRATERENKEEVGGRIYDTLIYILARPESNIGVATHSGWLMTLFNGVVECEGELKEWFQTGEVKTVALSWLERID